MTDDDKKSLAVLSRSATSSTGAFNACLDPETPAGDILAYEFDTIKLRQNKGRPFKGKSADALIVADDEYYLIEFKTGGIAVDDVLRKAYDSALVLIEMGALTWQGCREHLTFIVVGKEMEKRFQQIYKTPLSDCMQPGYKQVNMDPRVISGQVVKEVLLQTVLDFENYASEKKWC